MTRQEIIASFLIALVAGGIVFSCLSQTSPTIPDTTETCYIFATETGMHTWFVWEVLDKRPAEHGYFYVTLRRAGSGADGAVSLWREFPFEVGDYVVAYTAGGLLLRVSDAGETMPIAIPATKLTSDDGQPIRLLSESELPESAAAKSIESSTQSAVESATKSIESG